MPGVFLFLHFADRPVNFRNIFCGRFTNRNMGQFGGPFRRGDRLKCPEESEDKFGIRPQPGTTTTGLGLTVISLVLVSSGILTSIWRWVSGWLQTSAAFHAYPLVSHTYSISRSSPRLHGDLYFTFRQIGIFL